VTWAGGYAGTDLVTATWASVHGASRIGLRQRASVSAARVGGVGSASIVWFRLHDGTEQTLCARRDFGREEQSRSASRVSNGFRPRRCSAGHALQGSSKLRLARHKAGRTVSLVDALRHVDWKAAWPVSNTVEMCSSERRSSSHRVTDGGKRELGDWRLRAVEQHEVG